MAQLILISTRIAVGLVLIATVSACIAPIKLSDDQIEEIVQNKFSGVYKAKLTSSREVFLQINPDLTYSYKEDSFNRGIIHQVVREGRIKVKSNKEARLGRVRLHWLNPHNIEVWSPYSATIGHGNNQTRVDGTGGVFMSPAPGHVFYLNRVFKKLE